MASVPGIAAANSGPVGAMPLWTPPLTPAPGHGTHSASSSVSGLPVASGNVRRESESEREDVGSTSKKRDSDAVADAGENKGSKIRHGKQQEEQQRKKKEEQQWTMKQSAFYLKYQYAVEEVQQEKKKPFLRRLLKKFAPVH